MGRTIGIISGSGPEAGLDLQQKVLTAHRRLLGPDYRGDIDAPRVITISEPRLGRSMDLPESESDVWDALRATAKQLSAQVDVFAIACNTLNVFAERIQRLELTAELVSFADVAVAYVEQQRLGRIGLLGAAPVTALDRWSPYRHLADRVDVVVPADPDTLHRLIHDIKLAGGSTPELAGRFAEIVEALGVAPILLACTELPLLDSRPMRAELLDVTELVADALVRRAA